MENPNVNFYTSSLNMQSYQHTQAIKLKAHARMNLQPNRKDMKQILIRKENILRVL